jgi:hypothetical protein
LLLLLQDRSGEGIQPDSRASRRHTENRHYHSLRPVRVPLHVLRPAQRRPDVSALHGRHSAGTRLMLRLPRFPRFLPITRGPRATSTCHLRPAADVRDPNQPCEVRL